MILEACSNNAGEGKMFALLDGRTEALCTRRERNRTGSYSSCYATSRETGYVHAVWFTYYTGRKKREKLRKEEIREG